MNIEAPQDHNRSFSRPPPQWGGLDLHSRSSGCARLGGEVGPPLGVVVEEGLGAESIKVGLALFYQRCCCGGCPRGCRHSLSPP